MQLTFITGNQHKADFLAKWLGYPITHHKLDLDELQSLDLHEIVEHKVRQAYDILKKPVLVEDASLTFLAMGGLPGPFVKWFIQEIGYDGLRKLAHSLPSQDARGDVCYGYYDGKTLRTFDGVMHGRIANEPKGTGGFGFDPIFVNKGYDITRAEMSEDEYAKTSYRTDAMGKLKDFLATTNPSSRTQSNK
ncbi:MAG TPA: non-canonical purine NTP pyrophosphatase [Candidatus Saccharimonadales bacterium]|nr:non-canonical purine NTP pyrophosphatase [Candidatus Saccharimonadales bacterium]